MDSDFLLRITERAEYAAEKLNHYLTARVVKRILSLFEKNGEVDFIPSSISDMRKMQETGLLYQDVKKEIKDRLPNLQEEIDLAFERSANEITRDNDRFTEHVIKEENLDVTDFKPHKGDKRVNELLITKKEKTLLEKAYKKTNGTLYNLTGTTAEQWQKEFVRITDEAYWKITHGVSESTAIADAIDEAARFGSKVYYPSGHVDKIEVAVARAVRTGVNQAAGDMTIARAAAMGVSQVLTSSHLGARYTDKEEPANHMSWQGKVFDLDWNSPNLKEYMPVKKEEQKLSFYQKIRAALILSKKKNQSSGDFIEKTGYGTGEGICGWNCRHRFNLFWKGISTNNTEQYDSEENKRRYDLEQKQRSYERKLREIRKTVNGRKAAVEYAQTEEIKKEVKARLKEVKTQYSECLKKYLDYCESNDLKPLYDRLKVPEFKENE